MQNKNEKTFSGFYDFDSTEAKTILANKKALEFPVLTTANGETKLYRQIKWESVTYKGRTFDVPVIACMCGDDYKQITLSSLFGKEKVFVVDRAANGYQAGDRLKIDNLVEWTPELQSVASARNEAIMAVVADEMEINVITLWGHYDEPNARSFNVTFVKATKL